MNANCIAVPEILLPAEGTDLSAWAVIACDQYSSDKKYWEELDRYVGDRPSTLRMIFPEVYMEGDCTAREDSVKRAMKRYLSEKRFRKLPPGFILTERETKFNPMRRGIVLAVDLEAYSFRHEDRALIRSSEGTILERIPPRMKIRRDAPLEFPHIMLLYDDPEDRVMRTARAEAGETVYDFDLNMGGGHIRGKFIGNTDSVTGALLSVRRDGMQFIVGDGNHSLATAKACWEEIKGDLTEEERRVHPARFCLCEAVNIYDEGIVFGAIHRVVKGADPDSFVPLFERDPDGNGCLFVRGERIPVRFPENAAQAVARADGIIAEYLQDHTGAADYIHGEEYLRKLTEDNPGYIGIALPKMSKDMLFGQILAHGNLPRKTFSIGESVEKRYYLEGKEIRSCSV